MTQLYERLARRSASDARDYRTSARTAEEPRNPPLRVAFIGARGVIGKYSGIEGYYEEVGRRLVKSGHEVTISCRSYFTPRSARTQWNATGAPSNRAFQAFLETGGSHLPEQRACDVWGDVTSCTITRSARLFFSFLPRLAGKKIVVTVQGLDWQRKKWGRFAAAVLRLGERAAVTIPHRTMVVSRTLREYFEQKYGADTVYVPNGAPLRERRGNDLLQGWGLETGKYILFLGRFSPEKNCDLLIDAFEKLNTDTVLVLAGGSGASDAYARGLLCHASQRIRFLNYVAGEALDQLLTNTMLLALPSDMEGLSLALLEGMGAGRCVLASDIPENVELVHGAGFTFKRGDGADLREKLALLIADPEARDRAGQKARRRIEEQYQWDSITAEIEKLYGEVTGGARIRTFVSPDETKGTLSELRRPAESATATREERLKRHAS